MINKILKFIKSNYKPIIQLGIALFLVYWIVFVLTPKAGLSSEQEKKLDSLKISIKNLESHNQYLDGRITDFNEQINAVDDNIQNIKGQKTIIKEYYYEKISNVDKLTNVELDSFFTNRYQY